MSQTSSLSTRGSISDSDYFGSDEANEIDDFFENGIISGVKLEPGDDEVPPQTEQEANDEEKINTQASQAVDNLSQYEQPQSQEQLLETITEELEESESSIPLEEPESKRIPKQTSFYRPPDNRPKRKQKKKPIPQPILGDSQQQILSQVANQAIIDETGSIRSVARKFVIENIRLETSTPDTQSNFIYGTNMRLLKDESCYLCGFKFKDRVSHNHNVRWKKTDLTEETKSYDHTAPVNFSFIVSRIPSEYNISYMTDGEKDHLKSNGKYACFHCNFTKSQRMFITCPKKGKSIDFRDFNYNEPAIENFVDDLLNSTSDWALGPIGENTLHECIKKYYNGDENKWKAERIQSIKNSADDVCTMIKKHVDQKSVIKRYYYTKLLIQKAQTLLDVDPQYKVLPTPKKQNIYRKKFIAHYLAKAEATNTNFVRPWKLKRYISTGGPSPAIEGNPPSSPGTSERPYGSSRRKRIRKRTRKSKRKTFRRKRLF